MRDSRLYLAAVIAVGAFALLIAVQPSAPDPTATPTPTPALSTTSSRFAPGDGRIWVGDWDDDCATCLAESSISFRNGELYGAVGAGDGCNAFTGTYQTDGELLTITIASPEDQAADGCDPRGTLRIVRRLLSVKAYELTGCETTICKLGLYNQLGVGTLSYTE
jgi:hypothetical protein